MIQAKFLAFSSKKIIFKTETPMCFGSNVHVKNYMLGLVTGYHLAGKKDIGVAAIIDDDLDNVETLDLNRKHVDILNQYRNSVMSELWNRMVNYTVGNPALKEYSKIFPGVKSPCEAEKIIKYLSRFNVVNFAYDPDRREFIIDGFKDRQAAETCFYSLIPFWTMNATIEDYENGQGYFICIKA